MAKMFSFTLCEAIKNESAGSTDSPPTLVSPQIALRPQYIPSNFSFGIALGVSDVDITQENKIKFDVTAPGNTIIFESGEENLPIIPKPDVLPKEDQGFMMCIDLRNFAIPYEGRYTFSFYLNGECFAEQIVPIYPKGEA